MKASEKLFKYIEDNNFDIDAFANALGYAKRNSLYKIRDREDTLSIRVIREWAEKLSLPYNYFYPDSYQDELNKDNTHTIDLDEILNDLLKICYTKGCNCVDPLEKVIYKILAAKHNIERS